MINRERLLAEIKAAVGFAVMSVEAESRPCDGCWDVLDAAGIRKVVYS